MRQCVAVFFCSEECLPGFFKVFTTLEARLESNLCPIDLKKSKATTTGLDHYCYYMSQTILDRLIRMKKDSNKNKSGLID